MALNIELVPRTASLTIGDDYAKTNTIEFRIKLTGNGAVWLSLQIPVGDTGVIRALEDANDMEVTTPTLRDPQPQRKKSPLPSAMEWWLGDYRNGVQVDGSTEIPVSISHVLCRANAGDAQITIIGKINNSSITRPLTLTKAKPTKADDPILYFIATPTSVIGQDEVMLSWEIVGDQEVTLETPNGQEKMASAVSCAQQVTETFTYTLHAGSKQRQVTVNVLTAGWHTMHPLRDQALPSVINAFPSVIFDSIGGTQNPLYAIFVREKPERQAVLCQSADGIRGWHIINDAVPDGMESSPGVLLRDCLWLIGGSAVDPAQKSNRIYCYDLKQPTHGWQERKVPGFHPRMGHACVIVDDSTIWILGGLDKYQTCLNDVLSLTIDRGDPTKLSVNRLKPPAWDPRCMFSAINFNNMIWVCGGVTEPIGDPLGDLWASPLSSTSWDKRPTGASGAIVAHAIGTGAAALWDTLFTVVMNRTGGPNWRLEPAMWTIGKGDMKNSSDTWTLSTNTPELPLHQGPTPHSIAMVGFQGRLYLRRLSRDTMYATPVVDAPLFVYVESEP